jgi:hypothetical protein
VFTRALREADRHRAYGVWTSTLSARSRGSCRTCRLATRTTSSIRAKGAIRVDSSNTNYNGAPQHRVLHR